MNAVADDIVVTVESLDPLEREIRSTADRIATQAKINGVEHIRPGATLATVRTLRRLGIRLARLYLIGANDRELTPIESRTERAIEGRAMMLGHMIGVTIRLNGDPRGCPLEIPCAKSLANGWGGDCIVIPTAPKREYRR